MFICWYNFQRFLELINFFLNRIWKQIKNILSKKKGEKFQTFQSQRFLYQEKKDSEVREKKSP